MYVLEKNHFIFWWITLISVSLGLAQYSGDPRIEWHLNAYGTKDAVLDAVRNLPYKGGNTLTGTVNVLAFAFY